jgi:hypothetical protein
MKTFVLTILLTALTSGIAAAGYSFQTCGNTKACNDARAAFAEHHHGQYPTQYYNQWYQGRQGRWNHKGTNWRWEGLRGDRYAQGHNGWQWSGTPQKDSSKRD